MTNDTASLTVIEFVPNDPHMGGPAWTAHRDGKHIGTAKTEAGAEHIAAMVAKYGYYDPSEARQRFEDSAPKLGLALGNAARLVLELKRLALPAYHDTVADGTVWTHALEANGSIVSQAYRVGSGGGLSRVTA